ncbi:ferredoxin [Falsiphaeobacter marinintestinus]|uniref:ferredoxin n=1 Tax=Falsiphaeobacter marinintestinus TaxID=1492905 RepID=UPI0011B8405B|nr:ferredoxin [Phaeobacter marinintestinus]
MSWSTIHSAADAAGLIVMGVVEDEDTGTIALLGTGPTFWSVFTASPEYGDGNPHPVDRWSKRVIGAMAAQVGASCSYPSDGPPYPPFIRWSIETGRFFQSPVGMMVHDTVGMLLSLRGALHLADHVAVVPIETASPCLTCVDQPCTTACPVGALSADAPYDVSACHGFLDTEAGKSCMLGGCAARLACPISAGAQRPPAQSALHMLSFHPGGDIT